MIKKITLNLFLAALFIDVIYIGARLNPGTGDIPTDMLLIAGIAGILYFSAIVVSAISKWAHSRKMDREAREKINKAYAEGRVEVRKVGDMPDDFVKIIHDKKDWRK